MEQAFQVALLRDGFADFEKRLELTAGLFQAGSTRWDTGDFLGVLHENQNSTRFAWVTISRHYANVGDFEYTRALHVSGGLANVKRKNRRRESVWLCAALWLAVIVHLVACGQAPAPARAPDRPEEAAHARSDSSPNSANRYDLERDEARGGHTLDRHVGRTDEELRERLRRERNISAASTWTDRETAEITVAQALRAERGRIESWMRRGFPRANLALHYDAGRTIGRSLRHGEEQTVDCTSAVIVLRADGPDSFYVLTTYPEERE